MDINPSMNSGETSDINTDTEAKIPQKSETSKLEPPPQSVLDQVRKVGLRQSLGGHISDVRLGLPTIEEVEEEEKEQEPGPEVHQHTAAASTQNEEPGPRAPQNRNEHERRQAADNRLRYDPALLTLSLISYLMDVTVSVIHCAFTLGIVWLVGDITGLYDITF